MKNKIFFVKPIVQWKMRLPEKKSLVPNDRQNEMDSRARKIAAKKRLDPLHVLSQFQN
jgi:hypothetical protein